MFSLRRLVFPVCCGLALAAIATRAHAQDDAPPPVPASPSTLPENPAPATTEPADIQLQSDDDVTSLLEQYGRLTGKRMIYDGTVQGTVKININKKVTKTEAIRIIEVALNLNGFALVPAGGDIVKVLGLSKNPRSAGVPIYSDLAQVPESEDTVSFLVRLRYLDAQEVAALLTQYIPPGTTANFTAMQKSGALLITETANTVRRLVTLINSIDLPVAPVTEKFIRLERADATKAVDFLNNVFDLKSASNGGGGVPNPAAARRPIRRLNEEGQPIVDNNPLIPGQLPLLSGDSIIQGRLTLTADVRTNRVHVVTSPLNMPLVEQLIHDFDADAPFAEPVRRPLRFVKAKDILPILVQCLTEPGTDNNGNTANGSQQPNRQPNQPTRNNPTSTTESGTGNDSTVGQEELSVEPADTVPQIETVGNTKIIADPGSNTIILLGGAESKDKVFKVLDTLDVRKRQIIIRVVIGELAIGNNSEFGLQYLLRQNRSLAASQFQSGFLNNGTTTPTTTTDPTTGVVTTTNNTTTGATSTLSDLATLASGLPTGFSGLAGIISVTKKFDVIISALEATNRFKTINRPVLFTSNAEKATIINGTEIAVPTSSLSTANNIGGTTTNGASISSNVDFKKVALQLEVLPLINSDREVTLEIVQKLDSLVQGGNVQVGGNSIPTIANRELKSTVSMQSGATVVLGGLITESDSKTNSDIPYLSRLPLLGDLFKARTHDVNRSELIILLHPEVLGSPEQVDDATLAEQNRTYLGTGLEDQLLPNFPVRKAIPVEQPTPTPRRHPVQPAPK